METKANYVAVGAFVLVCMLGLVISLLWLAGLQYNQEFAYYQTDFTGPVTGLGKGTTVRYNGIDVGRVDSLQFDPNDPQVVIATLQVEPHLGIRVDSVTSIESQGLTGGTYVEISGGSKGAAVLTAQDDQRYPVIKSAPSALQKLATGAPQLLQKLNEAADRINAVLNDDNQVAFAHILANLDKTTGALAGRSGDIDATLRNVSEASKDLPGTVADVDKSVRKLNQLAGDSDEFVKGQGLEQFAQLLADTRKLVISLNRLSDQLNRQPTKLLFGDQRKGYTPK
ncbi:MAG: MCE family protein [Alphaproteobacteria bacterium]|nr:MCE family protein [Alphaproteobacteria bacterium]MDE2112992.1 MCE family protein [Alphaproteobacteria bacterium]MDE2492482.1 MCE family protein [Alphaproteobacteria bacterium]